MTEHQAALTDNYAEFGYLIFRNWLDRNVIDAANDALAEIEAKPEQYQPYVDFEPDAPTVLRRLRHAHRAHAAFDRIARDKRVLQAIKPLLGPAIRLHGSKINMKAPGSTASVEWHQDWAFYPHSNDDVLAVGIMLDAVTDENGPLLVLPKTHRARLASHHNGPGRSFTGAIKPDGDGFDFDCGIALTGDTGTLTVHHARLVHGSAANRSSIPRRLFLIEYAAADAWPLRGVDDYDDYASRLVCGTEPKSVRMAPVPVRMPFPRAGDDPSLFRVQHHQKDRYFVADQ